MRYTLSLNKKYYPYDIFFQEDRAILSDKNNDGNSGKDCQVNINTHDSSILQCFYIPIKYETLPSQFKSGQNVPIVMKCEKSYRFQIRCLFATVHSDHNKVEFKYENERIQKKSNLKTHPLPAEYYLRIILKFFSRMLKKTLILE